MTRIKKTAPMVGLCAQFLLMALVPAALVRAQDAELEGFYIGGGSEQSEPFRVRGRGWTSTATQPSTVGQGLGQPATVTWSVVPDNTTLPTGLGEPASNSNLIEFLDGVHHEGESPGGEDLSERNWWELMNSVFTRWDELSGVSFVYEPNDDGTRLGSLPGELGVRGDYRIGGHSIDGQISPTFLAYNFFPNNSDMVIDTDEINRWSNDSRNYLLFRNMMMHEVGHGIGLDHVESEDRLPEVPGHQFGTFLMEPILSNLFDGPQFDDILGAHRIYGDVNEENGANDTYQTATSLGILELGQSLSIGTDAGDTFVKPTDIDFVSIDDESDIDFFQFSVINPQEITILLTPMGPTYDEGRQGSGENGTQQPFVSSAKNDLSLALFGPGGTSQLLELADNTSAGFSEVITRHQLTTPGEYFIRVAGQTFNQAQLFQLELHSVPEPSTCWLAAVVLCTCCASGRHR